MQEENKLPEPVGDRVIIEPIDETKKLENGFAIGKTSDGLRRGIVVAQAPKQFHRDPINGSQVSVGDTVSFGTHSFQEVPFNDKKYFVGSDTDVQFILEKANK